MAKMRKGIVQRGKTWTYMIRVPDPSTGRTKQRWVGGFATYKKAETARLEALASLRSGTYVADDKQTVSEYLRDWLNCKDAAPKTLDGYRYHVEHYVIPAIGAMRLQQVTGSTLTKLYKDLRATGGRHHGELGHPSVAAIARTLSSAFGAAEKSGLLASNPARRASLPPRPVIDTRAEYEDLKFKVFSPEQVVVFTRHVVGAHRLGALFHLAAYTGARRGELLHLRWEDVRWERQQLHIRGSRGFSLGAVRDGPTKNKKPRTISIDATTISVLRGHRQRQLEERMVAGELWEGEDDFIFRRENGRWLWPDTPTGLMEGLCAGAGVPRRKLHELRHTHATILLNAGEPVHEVSHRLGHSDVKETLNTYARIIEARQNALGDRFAAALNMSS